MFANFFSKESIVAPPGFNRWRVPPASMGIHLCIGSVYAWSIYNPALVKALGVAVSAPNDWTLNEVVWIFTVSIVSLGLAAAFAGRWLEEVGPRTVGVVAAVCWGGGYLVGSAGIALHQLWLVYLGYGVIGGIGLGLGYVSPVSTLIRWFPDRRGMATGMAIMGFGGGAMLATPLKEYFLQTFYKAPEYLGRVADLDIITKEGHRFVEAGGELKEVVVVGVNEVANMVVPGEPGAYLLGSGSVGAWETFLSMGLIYFVVMIIAALSYRIPAKDWRPEGWMPPSDDVAKKKMMTRGSVDIDQALKTPQFYQLWIVLCFNVTAGIGVIGVAKTMMTEIFGSTLPSLVDSAFAAAYVLMISVFNMVGRIIWASSSDYIGRRNTYWIFFVGGIILYLSIPWTAQQVSITPAVFYLVLFYAATMIIFTFYGGGFATIPAYLADVFGTHHVGGIHGRLLTAWSTAGVLGPLAITSLRQNSLNEAIHDLAQQVDPQRFYQAFGARVGELELLIENKVVTLAKLLEIAPPGTVDPTPSLYNTTMYLMAFLLFLALISNAFMRPVASKHLMQN